jgi:hypothetical protein
MTPDDTHRLLHCEECQDLQQVVLNDVTDYPILVKVTATTLGAKVLTENDLRMVQQGGNDSSGGGEGGRTHSKVDVWLLSRKCPDA